MFLLTNTNFNKGTRCSGTSFLFILAFMLTKVVCSVIYSFKIVNVCTFPYTIHLSPYRRNGCCFSPSFRSKTRRQSCQGGPTPPSVWKRMQRTLIPARKFVNASLQRKGICSPNGNVNVHMDYVYFDFIIVFFFPRLYTILTLLMII